MKPLHLSGGWSIREAEPHWSHRCENCSSTKRSLLPDAGCGTIRGSVVPWGQVTLPKSDVEAHGWQGCGQASSQGRLCRCVQTPPAFLPLRANSALTRAKLSINRLRARCSLTCLQAVSTTFSREVARHLERGRPPCSGCPPHPDSHDIERGVQRTPDDARWHRHNHIAGRGDSFGNRL